MIGSTGGTKLYIVTVLVLRSQVRMTSVGTTVVSTQDTATGATVEVGWPVSRRSLLPGGVRTTGVTTSLHTQLRPRGPTRHIGGGTTSITKVDPSCAGETVEKTETTS